MHDADIVALDLALSRWERAEGVPEWPWVDVEALGSGHPLAELALQKAVVSGVRRDDWDHVWIPVTALSPRWVAEHLMEQTEAWDDLVAHIRPIADRVCPLPQEAWLRMLASSFSFSSDWQECLHDALVHARASSLDGIRDRLPIQSFDVGVRGRPTAEALELILGALPGYSVISEAGLPAVIVEVTQVSAETWRQALQDLKDAKLGDRDETPSKRRLLELGHHRDDLEELWNKLPGPVRLELPTCPDTVRSLDSTVPSKVLRSVEPYLGDLARILPTLGESGALPLIGGQELDSLTLHRYLEKALPTARRFVQGALKDVLPFFHSWLKQAVPGESDRLLLVLAEKLSGEPTMAEAVALMQIAALVPPEGIKVQSREPVLVSVDGPGQSWLDEWISPRVSVVPKKETWVSVDEFYREVTREVFLRRPFHEVDPFWSLLEDVFVDATVTPEMGRLKVDLDVSLRRLDHGRQTLVQRGYLKHYETFRLAGNRMAEILTHLGEAISLVDLIEDVCRHANIHKPTSSSQVRRMVACLKLHPVKEDHISCRLVMPRQWQIVRVHPDGQPDSLWLCPKDKAHRNKRREWPDDRDRMELQLNLSRWQGMPGAPSGGAVDARVDDLWRRSVEAARALSPVSLDSVSTPIRG
ncbi:MAG: hypothetical protein VKO64_04965 [Candidatus Sericytochromatia bacterium]|nr:hypothetical protein [Candidatus Sericytochromatia bacterium]